MESPPVGTVEVELLGLARLLTRRESVSVAVAETLSLREFLRALAAELPALAGTVCTEDGTLLGGYALSRSGADLLRDPSEPIRPGDQLLLLSTLAGGTCLQAR